MAEQLDRPLYSSASVLDSELEAIKATIDRHELEVGEAKLKELEARAPDKLQPHHWYQLKALRSRIYSARWKWEKAGRELLDAKRHTPTTDRARINEALGYELVGEPDRAHQIATELRKELTQSVRLITIWIRTAPPTIAFATLVEVAAPFVQDDEELNLALAHRGLAAGRFAEAIPFANRATEIGPDSPQAWFILGQTKHALGFSRSPTVHAAQLREALDHYDRAVELAHTQKLVGLEAAVRFNRGKVRYLLGDLRAEADYASAIELAGPEEHFRTEYAGFLLDAGRPDEALRELETETGEPSGHRLFYEALARRERNRGDDWKLAEALLRRIVADENSDRWVDAHMLLVQWAIESKDLVAGRAVITSAKLRQVSPFAYHTLLGWLADSDGRRDIAQTEYKEATNWVQPSTPRDHVFLLAQALVAVGEDEIALPFLERCYRPGVFDFECRKLLGCAQRLERHDVSVRVCRDLRETGEADPRIVQTEISVLQMYDPQAALALATKYLAGHPDDQVVALWQSAIALRLGQQDLVVADPLRLPPPEELTPEGGSLAATILTETRQHSAALSYAYRVLRSHFGEEFAHGQYIATFLKLSDHCPELQVGEDVALGMAVRYCDDREELDKWVVLEESAEADLARGELMPEHPLSRALVGRKLGEAVVLSEGDIQPRSVTIRELAHKFVYQFRECLSQYRVRFPNGRAVQLVEVGDEDGFDPSPIIKGLSDRKRFLEELDRTYRSNPLPFATYAELSGGDDFAAWGHLLSKPDLGIRCSTGQHQGLLTAIQLAKDSSTVVVDLTAIMTLAQLDLLKVLGTLSGSAIISQSTIDRIRHHLDRAEDDRRSAGSIMLTDDGQLAHMEASADARNQFRTFLESVCAAIQMHCEIRPCPQAAQLDPKKRADYVNAIGRHNLEALLLAATPGAILWTDDLILGNIGREEFQTNRVWTQPILMVSHERGVITLGEFDKAVAKLVGWYFNGIELNARTLLAAVEVAGWQMQHWPVPQVMRTLSNSEVDPERRLLAAAEAVRGIWQLKWTLTERRAFVFAVLDGLQSVQLVQTLILVVSRLFENDARAGDEARGAILYWLGSISPTLIPRQFRSH
jgi:tetratricopeptide (TPR) repeat protein